MELRSLPVNAIPAGAVVVGVDGSDPGDAAVAWAADQAALEHRPLVLAHAIGTLGTSGTVWLSEGADPAPVLRDLHEHANTVLEAAAAHVARRRPSVVVHTTTAADDPRQMLLDLSRHAGTVVVGSRGRGPVRSLLLGSVSAATARHATCPVVVVRPHHPGIVRRGVLVGADGSPASLPVLEFAFREAAQRRLPLTVMHCVWDAVATVTTPHVVGTDASSVEEARLLLAESIAGLGEKHPDVHVTQQVARGLPGACLGQVADSMDLVVVGRRQAGAWSRVVDGDVSHDLVEHARTVVAVVPELSR